MSLDVERLASQLDRQQFFLDKESASDSDARIHVPRNPALKRKSLNEMQILNRDIKEKMGRLIKKCNQFIGEIEGKKPNWVLRKKDFISRVSKYVDSEPNPLRLNHENRKGLHYLERLKYILRRIDYVYDLGKLFIPWSVVRNHRPRCINTNPYAWLEN